MPEEKARICSRIQKWKRCWYLERGKGRRPPKEREMDECEPVYNILPETGQSKTGRDGAVETGAVQEG